MYRILAVRGRGTQLPWINMIVSDDPVVYGDTYVCKYTKEWTDEWDWYDTSNSYYGEYIEEPSRHKYKGWKIYKVICTV